MLITKISYKCHVLRVTSFVWYLATHDILILHNSLHCGISMDQYKESLICNSAEFLCIKEL